LDLFNDDALADFAMEMDGAKRSAVEEEEGGNLLRGLPPIRN
jgi:hypothetical protein